MVKSQKNLKISLILLRAARGGGEGGGVGGLQLSWALHVNLELDEHILQVVAIQFFLSLGICNHECADN